MGEKRSALPLAVAQLRAAAYREMIALCEALGLDYACVNFRFSQAGEGRGLAFRAAAYEQLLKRVPDLLDKRYFHLLSPWTEPEYPFPQARLCVHGSSMEQPLCAELAMHQGVYINLYPLYERAFFAGRQERDYLKIQAQILAFCVEKNEDGLEGRRAEEHYHRLIEKRAQIMCAGETEGNKRALQLFPFDAQDYALGLVEAWRLDASLERLLEPEDEDWSAFEFELADDLIATFDLTP